MAIEAGVRVVPVGISFPHHQGDAPIPDGEPMAITFGPSLEPPREVDGTREVQAFHQQIFEQLSALCGKTFSPDAPRRKTR